MPDTTPGVSTGTTVSNSGSTYVIDGGTLKGSNLFESFTTFSLGTGDTASWTYTSGNPDAVDNVINRVTGGIPSDIDGTVSSTGLPNASFYFINPAGIVFGRGAKVDVPGSAYFSTAQDMEFSDGATYSASTPSGSRLTTANPVAFGFLGGPGNIAIDDDGSNLGRPGLALSFSAANIDVSNAKMGAGGIDLAAVGNQSLSLPISEFSSAAPLEGNLTINDSEILARSFDGAKGDISLAGGDVVINDSDVQSEATSDAPGGDLDIRAQTLTMERKAAAGTSTDTNQNAGNLSVTTTNQLNLIDGGQLYSSTTWAGSAGNINVTTQGLLLDGSHNGYAAIVSNTTASGDAGQVVISVVGNAQLLDGGFINSDTYGSGNAGDVRFNAANLAVDGGANKYADIASDSTTDRHDNVGTGNAGTVTVNVLGNMSILDRANVTSEAEDSTGLGGAVTVNAGNLLIDGGPARNSFAGISSSTYSSENAGQVQVNVAGNLIVRNEGIIESNTYGTGSAGDVNVDAKDLHVDGGASHYAQISSNSTTMAGSVGTGNAGKVTIGASGTLTIENGAQLTSEADDKSGNAGDVDVSAGNILVSGGAASFADISSSTDGAGTGGLVGVTTPGNLTVRNGGEILSDTLGSGDAGGVLVNAGSLLIDGGKSGYAEIASNSMSQSGYVGTGNAGTVTIDVSGAMSVKNRGDVSSDADDSFGNAGDVNISAANLQIDGDRSFAAISTDTSGSGNAGQVVVDVRGNVSVTNGGYIDSDTFGLGDAGDVYVGSANLEIDGGGAGYAHISSDSIANEFGHVPTGNAGKVTIDVADNMTVRNNGYVTSQAKNAIGNGGDVNVAAGSLLLDGAAARSAFISTDTFGAGIAGRVNVNVSGAMTIEDGGYVDSDTLAESGGGKAGDVTIGAGSLVVDGGAHDFADISSESHGSGDGGSVNVTATNIEIGARGDVSSSAFDSGNAGTVSVTGANITLSERGAIASLSSGRRGGNAGNLTINAGDLTLQSGAQITTDSANANTSGDIAIRASDIAIDGTGSTIASTNTSSEGGVAGTISITGGPLILSNGGAITTNSAAGPAGDISLTFLNGGYLLLEGASSPGLITTSSGIKSGGHIDIVDPTAIILDGGEIQALGPVNAADVTIETPGIIESADRFNEIAVAGTLDLQSQVIDVSSSLALNNLGFADASKILGGRCAEHARSGEISQLKRLSTGPYTQPPQPRAATARTAGIFQATPSGCANLPGATP